MAKRYETPSYEVNIASESDLTGCDVYVTFRQGRRSLTLKLNDMDDYQVTEGGARSTVTLTQSQTGAFQEGGLVEVQANVIDQSGYRAASEIVTTTFGRQLLEVTKRHGD